MEEENNRNLFWINNIKILYTNENYLNFIPVSTMTRYEQFNAITRLCIYIIILSIIFGANSMWYQIPIIIIILLIVLVHLNIVKNNTHVINNTSQNLLSEIINTSVPDDIPENYNSDGTLIKKKKVQFVEAGYYDPNGNLTVPSDFKKKQSTQKKCRMPSTDNPFMNPTVFDAAEDSPPLACNSDDIDIDLLNKQVTNNFNDQLFRDVSDLYNVKNSQRQYYSISGSKTPDTVGFANWLYGNMPACKSNQSNCYKYEDLSQIRPLTIRKI
jgi:hypothetical protein